ncbi:autotransporter domain-containing protein, partial [Sutterella wadsworthensis]|uniref:autotransporter domain-containing protein n=1 Tax=Sutterella wadsworthensis TaxID=40545 RepID=UPI00307F574E
KGTKTVIAAAVAALSLGAGVASAAPATGTVTSGTATVEGSFTITNDASAAGGLSADKVAVTDTDGAEVKVEDWSKQTLDSSNKLNITLKGGELTTTFDDKASKDLTVTLGKVEGAGTISMTATKGAEGKAYGQALTVDTLALSEGDLNFSASGTGAKTGAISITTAEAGDITLGTDEVKPDGSSVPTTAAKAANITVNDVALAVTLTATKANFDYNAGTVTNAGTLTLAATKDGDNTGVVTLDKDVSFANSGTVAIKGDKVQFDASYDATSEANKSGYLEVKSTAASDGTITVGGTLTADTIKLGEKTADDAKGNRQEKNQIVLDAETITVAKDGKLDVKNTLTLEKNLTVQGIVNTAATDVKVIGSGDQATNNAVKVTVGVTDSTHAGSVSLGKVTVGAGTADQANSLTVSVANGASAQADSLDIAAEVKDKDGSTTKNTAGKFVLASGKFNAGTLTNGGSVSIGDSGAATLTVSGTSVNKGEVTFNQSNKSALVIAADSTFSNEGDLGKADSTNSDITVAGTLTNVYKEESKTGANDGITGKINAATVNVEEGGVVNAALGDNYKVTTTNVAGTFATDLNAKLKDDGTLDTTATKGFNTLKLTSQFVLNGGSITDRAETPADIKDFYIADSGSLTLGSDKELGTVVIKTTNATDKGLIVEEGAVTVADLTLTKGTVVIDGEGSLAADALTTTENESTIDVSKGTLSTTLAGIGLKIADKDVEPVKTAATVANGTIKIAQDGVWNLDLGENAVISSDGLSTLKRLVATDELKGLIDIGSAAVEVKGLDLTKETTYTQISDAGLLGVKTDALSQATITEVKTIGQTGDFGSLKLDSSVKDTLAVTAGTLTLNGSGAVVSYEKTKDNWVEANVTLSKDAGLVTTGEKATIGSISKAASATGTFVEVASNSLEVKGNIDVDGIYVGNDEGTASSLTVTKVGDASTVKTGEFEIEAGAAFVAADADVTLTSDKKVNFDDRSGADIYKDVNYVAGSAEAKNLKVTNGDLLVTGDLKVTDTLEGRVIVGTDKSAGSLVVNNLKGTVFADPAWVDGKSEAASTVLVKALATEGTVEAGRNSVVTVGGEKAFTADEVQALTGFTLAETPTDDNETTGVKAVKSIDTYTVNSVVVLGGDKTTVMNGVIVASNSEQPSAGQYQVSIDRNSMLVVDALKLDTTGETALFAQQTTLADGSILFIDNAANGQKFLLSKANGTSYRADAVFEGNLLMEESYNKESNTLSIGMTDKSEVVDKLGDVAGLDAIYGMYEKGENVGNTNAKFFRDLMSSQTSSAYDKTTGEWNFQTIRTTLNDVAAIGATTGAQAVTMDAVNQMADTVAARTSVLTQRAQGVNGGRFEGKKVMDGAGYSSDIYAGTLGADYQFANGAVLGAALTIGTADTDSKGTTAKTSMDSDLVGFSVYGSKTFADIWNVAGDIGYLQASNDVTESGYGFGDFSEDVNAFTLGVRGEVLTKAGSVNIVPHLGLRYTRLSTDGFTAGFNTEIDDQNIFQMPVGVTVSADFETSGWTIAPKFDLSVVPTFGDKDADLKLGITGVSASDDLSVRVIDSNPVQATLGVSATNGAWGFGLNYKLGVGSDDRMNNSFNANVRYAF